MSEEMERAYQQAWTAESDDILSDLAHIAIGNAEYERGESIYRRGFAAGYEARGAVVLTAAEAAFLDDALAQIVVMWTPEEVALLNGLMPRLREAAESSTRG